MSNGKYCYPDSDVLINKYHIHDRQLLEKLEIQKVAVKLLGLDVHPQRIKATLDIAHLTSVHKYLFGDLYEWAGTFRDENLYKSERVLSGGSAEYADYHDIERKLNTLFHKNEGSPGQALKRLLGLRTFGSPAAQTLASHTSFAGM